MLQNTNERIRYEKVTWADLKTHISPIVPLLYDIKNLKNTSYFKCYVKHNNVVFFTNIFHSGHKKFSQADHDDFVNNYKPTIDSILPTESGLVDGSRIITHSTARPIGTISHFTCRSDDVADMSKVGGEVPENKKAKWTHTAGSGTGPANADTCYIDFNTMENETYIREGVFISWKDALNDELMVKMVPKVTNYTAGTNTFYNLYGGYLIIPAAGDGTINVAPQDMMLVEMPPNEFGIRSAGFWNADYNSTTKLFENITAAPFGNGVYNMFGLEVVLECFGNGIPLLGDGCIRIPTDDASRITQNIRLVASAITYGTDHTWYGNACISMYRKKSV